MDIARLMSLAFHGNVSSMKQMMSINYFLDALDDPDFELKIKEKIRTKLTLRPIDSRWLE